MTKFDKMKMVAKGSVALFLLAPQMAGAMDYTKPTGNFDFDYDFTNRCGEKGEMLYRSETANDCINFLKQHINSSDPHIKSKVLYFISLHESKPIFQSPAVEANADALREKVVEVLRQPESAPILQSMAPEQKESLKKVYTDYYQEHFHRAPRAEEDVFRANRNAQEEQAQDQNHQQQDDQANQQNQNHQQQNDQAKDEAEARKRRNEELKRKRQERDAKAEEMRKKAEDRKRAADEKKAEEQAAQAKATAEAKAKAEADRVAAEKARAQAKATAEAKAQTEADEDAREKAKAERLRKQQEDEARAKVEAEAAKKKNEKSSSSQPKSPNTKEAEKAKQAKGAQEQQSAKEKLAEQIRKNKEKAEADKKAKAEAEKEKAEKKPASRSTPTKNKEEQAKAEAARVAAEKAKEETEAKAKAEAARVAAEKAKEEAEAKTKAEADRVEAEKAKAEAGAKAKAEADRIAAEKAKVEAEAKAKADDAYKNNKRELTLEQFKQEKLEEANSLREQEIEETKWGIKVKVKPYLGVPTILKFQDVKEMLNGLKGGLSKGILFDGQTLLPEGGSEIGLKHLEKLYQNKANDVFGGLILINVTQEETDPGVRKKKFVYGLFQSDQSMFDNIGFREESQADVAHPTSLLPEEENRMRGLLGFTQSEPLTYAKIKEAFNTKAKEQNPNIAMSDLREAKDRLGEKYKS